MPNSEEIAGHDWLPRREYVLELAEEGVDNPYVAACRRYEEKERRRKEIIPEHQDLCRDLLRAEREAARTLDTALGHNRTGREKMLDMETEEMTEAEEKLPARRERVTELREELDDLEEEYMEIAKFMARNYISVAERRVSIPQLPDRDDEIAKHGTRPVGIFDTQGRRMSA